MRAKTAVLDGEIVCLDDVGRPLFYDLMFRRQQQYFYAFDVLLLDGQDVRAMALVERKRLLRRIMPRGESRLLCVEHVSGKGCELFAAACDADLEGVVAKWSPGPYGLVDGRSSWMKIKNSKYSQAEGRHDFFDRRIAPSAKPALLIQ